jgi:hypothetical protein
LHPAFVYAFEKLGYLVTEANAHTFTDDEIEAWEQALDEWVEANPDEETPNGAA